MKLIEVELKTTITIRRTLRVTDEGFDELNKLSENTVINGRKYIDQVKKEDKSTELNTTKSYALLQGIGHYSDMVSNDILCNDGTFNEIFYKEVEP